MLYKSLGLATFTVFYTTIIFMQPAYAYLDPGTGSMIIQIVVGAFIAAAAATRFYWEKIKSFFSGSEDAKNDKDT